MESTMTYAEFSAFVASAPFRWAESYAEKAPHWYTLVEDSEKETFRAAARFIAEHGVPRRWWGQTYRYVIVGKQKYWTMGAPVEETVVINRADANLTPGSHVLRYRP